MAVMGMLCPKAAFAEGEIAVAASGHLSYGSKIRIRAYPESTTPMACVGPCGPGTKKIAVGLNMAIEKICGSVGAGAPAASVGWMPITRVAFMPVIVVKGGTKTSTRCT